MTSRYNLVFHTAPFRHDRQFHWHVHIWPKLVSVAGFERGTGVMINITPPEFAASQLRTRVLSAVAGVLVRTEIDASPTEVWKVVSSIPCSRRVDGRRRRHPDHVAAPSGVGATFDCDTRIGPIELTDRMEVTEWREGAAIGVRHAGLVSGSGRFTLVEAPDGRTVFSWDEKLHFPWWLGGPLGEVPGGWVLRRDLDAQPDEPRDRRWLQPGRHPSVDDELAPVQ